MGVLIADRMELPFIYVRQAPKEHGLMRQVEGEYAHGAKVVLIEDHVSTGGSSLNAINGLLKEGLDVMALISIMTYSFRKTMEFFQDHQVQHVSLSNLDTVLEQATAEGLITADQAKKIYAFRDNPEAWQA